MKRIVVLLLSLMLVMCACACSAAESELPEAFVQTLERLYAAEGCSILSAAAWQPYGAAVIEAQDGCFLSVLSYGGNGWQVDFENHRAACKDTKVLMDSDTRLLLTDPFKWYDEGHAVYGFVRENEWVLSSAKEERAYASEWELGKESRTWLSDGELCTSIAYTDAEGHVLAERRGFIMPDVLTDEERRLASFDGFNPPIHGDGYTTNESMDLPDFLLRRLFAVIAPAGYTYADGILTQDGLQFVADKADDSRVLLCCAQQGESAGWRITESTPLPADTVIGIENFTHTLNLGLKGYGVDIGLRSDGTWGASGILSKGGEWFDLGPCWVSEGGFWWNASPVIGTAPWKDITEMDWSGIPQNLSEAKAMLDASGWATPSNPNPEDRLHLRELPRRDSRSLGKYYNGTPLQVLSRGDEWTQVRIGQQVGYMMTKYLLFGDRINTQPSVLTMKTNVNPTTEILWDDTAVPENITDYEVQGLLIVGVIGDKWYLVWNPDTDRYGRIWQTELWDGNG